MISLIYTIMEKKMICCKNFWCKCWVEVEENYDSLECPKCIDFNTNLSGGVSSEIKEYNGSRFDNQPHQSKYKVTNYK